MPQQKDTRPIVEKTGDVLYYPLAPPNDYLPEELYAGGLKRKRSSFFSYPLKHQLKTLTYPFASIKKHRF